MSCQLSLRVIVCNTRENDIKIHIIIVVRKFAGVIVSVLAKNCHIIYLFSQIL